MAVEDSSIRFCKKCGEHKPVSEFYKQKQRKDGISFYCKFCKKLAVKEWREKDVDRARALDRISRALRSEQISEDRRKRYAANPEKYRKQKADWTAANPVKTKDSRSRYYSKNRDKIRCRQAEYYAKNIEKRRAYNEATKEKRKEYRSLYCVQNKDKFRIYTSNRRAKTKHEKISIDIRDRLFKLQKGKCACCGLPLGDDYHIDHIMPLALGGSNTDDNIQLLRAECNLQKSSKHPVDFMQQRGFLL